LPHFPLVSSCLLLIFFILFLPSILPFHFVPNHYSQVIQSSPSSFHSLIFLLPISQASFDHSIFVASFLAATGSNTGHIIHI
jgi:hypothetical protein